jgi:hypothetical protein
MNSQMAHRLSRQSGSSLLELLAAMTAGLIVLGATLQCLSYFQREFARQQYDVGQEQDVRLSLELLQQELRLASLGSLSIARPDAIEFMANANGLTTNVTAPGEKGRTTLEVADGREWPEGKTMEVCWNDVCDRFSLARPGQRYLLTLVEPIARPIPPGASVMVMNRIRYYSRLDERGILRCLRQIDGGASVLIGNIRSMTFSYWDGHGRRTAQPELVRRVVVEVAPAHRPAKDKREITLRT